MARNRTPVILPFLLLLVWIGLPMPAGSGAPVEGLPIDTRAGEIDVEGGKLYYEMAGRGDTLVMIHDGALHRETWDEQWTPFARQFTVVRYDRRGYGKSATPTQPYSNVDDLGALFEQLGIRRAVLMGMSAGGGLAVDFALANPGRVEALVLVGAVVSGLGYTTHMYTRGGHFTAEDFADGQKFLSTWFLRDPYSIYSGNTAARERAQKLLDANPQNFNEANGRLARPVARPALHALGEIAVPTLILVGEYDIPDVHAHAGAMEAGIPGARRIIINGAGHLIPMEQPEAFNTEVIRFLLGRKIVAAIEAGRFDDARRLLAEARRDHEGLIPIGEDYLNGAGYRLLQEGKGGVAIETFKLCTEVFPDSWNAFDSLGEAYAANGETEAAIRSYARSIEMNPANENGKQALGRLREQRGARPARAPAEEVAPYLGLVPPGEEPQLFAPGIVSTGLNERDIAITPDGNEIYFTIYSDNFETWTILVSKRTATGWTRPETAPFSGRREYPEGEPCVSPDGQRFLFASSRPRDGATPGGKTHIWVMDRVGEGWSEPRFLDPPVNSDGEEFFPSVTSDGSLYFTRAAAGQRGNKILRSRLVNGAYTEPEELPSQVNAGVDRFNAFVAPDESYIILGIFGRPDSRGGTDYYISFRDRDDTWSEPVNLGDKINSPGRAEYSPYVTRDGKYFFYMAARMNGGKDGAPTRLTYDGLQKSAGLPRNGGTDIYWVDAGFLRRLAPK
jgi:pimeloyl-ACP methyl ester carboxylesterase